jgi:uncharacterized protein YlxW (UPF0749 family)
LERVTNVVRRWFTPSGGGGTVRRSPVWRVLVPVACLLAGVLFATSAETARGTDLRAGRRLDLAQLIPAEERTVAGLSAQVTRLQRQVGRLEAADGRGDRRATAAGNAADALELPVGLRAVHGPALTVTLDDAPRQAGGGLPPGARSADDVVVHQQDVQSVVNAMWAGGAEAMTIMGQRLITTGAIRCVGNVLLLYGRTYSPPYRITAIGDVAGMSRALGRERGVVVYREAAAAFGLGYQVSRSRRVQMPAYDGSVQLGYARVAR